MEEVKEPKGEVKMETGEDIKTELKSMVTESVVVYIGSNEYSKLEFWYIPAMKLLIVELSEGGKSFGVRSVNISDCRVRSDVYGSTGFTILPTHLELFDCLRNNKDSITATSPTRSKFDRVIGIRENIKSGLVKGLYVEVEFNISACPVVESLKTKRGYGINVDYSELEIEYLRSENEKLKKQISDKEFLIRHSDMVCSKKEYNNAIERLTRLESENRKLRMSIDNEKLYDEVRLSVTKKEKSGLDAFMNKPVQGSGRYIRDMDLGVDINENINENK